MNQYLPPPQQNMSNRLSLELNQVEIVNLLMQRTGTYNQMYQRPFETNIKLNELDAITEKDDEIDDIMTVDNVNKLVALSENLSSGALSQEGIVNTIRTLNKEDKKITVSGSKDGE